MRRYGALLALVVALSFAMPVAGPAASHAAPADCSAEISDPAGALTPAQVAQLTQHVAPLAQATELRIRTETSLESGSLNADEEALQKSCGWADAANVRQPRLLVIMVATQARQMGIYPGTALVGTITDPVWLGIEQQDMRPHFANKDWLGGLEAGADALSATLSSPPPAPAGQTPDASSDSGLEGDIVGGGILAITVLAVAAVILRRRPGRRYAPNGDYIGPHHTGAGYDRYGVPLGGNGFGGGTGGGGGSASGGGGGSSGF